MRFVIYGVTLGLVALLSWSCFVIDNQFKGIAPGPWRAILELEPKFITPNPKGQPLPEKVNLQFEEVSEGELPFNFEVIYDDDTTFHVLIKNGSEVIKVDQIAYGRDRSTGRDTLQIEFPVFDSVIKGFYEENLIEGKWIVRNRKVNPDLPYEIPFVARYGQAHRFTNLKKTPLMDLTGKWEATFEIERDTNYKAIAEFQQEGNKLTGTFRTETGDYRFLEGTVQEDKIYLSCFDGSHAFLFEAKILPDSSLIGSFRSGIHYKSLWEAKRNEAFKLKDPSELTSLRNGFDSFPFSFPNERGETIASTDERFRDKAQIIQLMGTWCPNCRDETKFLVDFLKEVQPSNLVVTALAFERHLEKQKARDAILRFKEQLSVPYEVLLAGTSEKDAASKVLPVLTKVEAFPTMIFIDKMGKVRKIHTGFSGPATSVYEGFRREFSNYVRQLTSE